MKRISPATERKLMAVIEKTAELVNDGLTPNAAIVKAASTTSLRPGEVSLVVHAYNTGRTSRQRQDGDDPFQKAAEFTLADTAEILETLYPSQVKTAAALEFDAAVSPEYSYGPGPLLERLAVREKQATVGVDWRTMNGQPIPAAPPLPTDDGYRYKKAMAQVSRLREATEETRRKMAAAFDQMGQTFMDLTTYFRRPDAHPMPVVKEAVLLLHGDKGVQLMDQLVVVTPGLSKLATHTLGASLIGVNGRGSFGVSVDDLDCTADPFPLVARFMGQLDTYGEKVAEHQIAVADYEQGAGEAITPFAEPVVSPSILGPSFDLLGKTAAGFDISAPLKMMGTYSLFDRAMKPVAEKLHGPNDNARLTKTINSLNDPEHEQQLRDINTQAMLQDLMLNDEVISGYDPHEVTGAFNDITQISPSVADQRMLMQALLRKKLQQGQLDTFEQDQLLGFEDKLRKQFQPLGKPGAKADGSVI